VHTLSPRASEPYITINCAAVAESLLESELFGHEEGAFTGATKQKEGKFELAMAPRCSSTRSGTCRSSSRPRSCASSSTSGSSASPGSESIQVNVRVIAATNADLKQAMAEGKFRPDLYESPSRSRPSRYRRSHSASRMCRCSPRISCRGFRQEVAGINVKEISAAPSIGSRSTSTRANVRELKNIVERAVYMAQGEVLTEADVDAALPPEAHGAAAVSGTTFADDPRRPLDERVDSFEEWLCRDATSGPGSSRRKPRPCSGITYDQFPTALSQVRPG